MPATYCMSTLSSVSETSSLPQSIVQYRPRVYIPAMDHQQNFFVLPQNGDSGEHGRSSKKSIKSSHGNSSACCLKKTSGCSCSFRNRYDEILNEHDAFESKKTYSRPTKNTSTAVSSCLTMGPKKSDASMEAIINKQRKLIVQLVKIIVKDRLQSSSSRDGDVTATHEPQQNKKARNRGRMAKELEHTQLLEQVKSLRVLQANGDRKSTTPNNMDNVTVHKSLERRTATQNHAPSSDIRNTEAELNSSDYHINDSNSADSLGLVTKSKGIDKKTSISDIELSELHNRTMELCAENGESVLSRLRSEFSKQLSSLKQELCENETTNFPTSDTHVVVSDNKDISMNKQIVNSIQNVTQDANDAMQQNECQESLSPISSDVAKDDNIVVVHDVDYDNNTLSHPQPSKVLDKLQDDLVTVKFGSESNKESENVGNGKRRRKPSANGSAETVVKKSEKEEYYFRRSPRKRCKKVVEKYVRRSASKQARKKIINQLKTTDSEFSPSSNSECSSEDEASHKKSQKKLLPPKLCQTFENRVQDCEEYYALNDNQCESISQDIADTQEASRSEDNKISSTPDIQNECIDQNERTTSGAFVDLTASDSNDAFTWVIPRSISSMSLPRFDHDVSCEKVDSLATVGSSCEVTKASDLNKQFCCENAAVIVSDGGEALDLTSPRLNPGKLNYCESHQNFSTVVNDVESMPLDLSIRRFSTNLKHYAKEQIVATSQRISAPASKTDNLKNVSNADQVFKEIPRPHLLPENKPISFNNARHVGSYHNQNFSSPLQDSGNILNKEKLVEPASLSENCAVEQKAEEIVRNELEYQHLNFNDDEGRQSGCVQSDDLTIEHHNWKSAGDHDFQEFDFTENSPPAISLKYWLSRRKKFPSSMFSFAKGHGVGFLRRSRKREMITESNVGSTIDSLRKVSKAKTIWKKLAKGGKLREYVAPSTNTRASRNKIHKRRAMLTISSSIENDSSRQDESSEEIIDNKVKKLRKRRDFKRSFLAKQVSRARRSFISGDKDTSSRHVDDFPFVASTSQTEESSEIDCVSESSPSILLKCDENDILTSLHMNLMSKYMNSPLKGKPMNAISNEDGHISRTNNSSVRHMGEGLQCEHFDTAIDGSTKNVNLQNGSGDFHGAFSPNPLIDNTENQARNQTTKSCKNYNSDSKLHSNHKVNEGSNCDETDGNKSVDIGNLQGDLNEVDRLLFETSTGKTSKNDLLESTILTPPRRRSKKNQISNKFDIKDEYISDDNSSPYPVSEITNNADEVNFHDKPHPLVLREEGCKTHNIANLIKNLSTDCVVPISPMKYHKSGKRWVKNNQILEPKKVKSPLRKTFFKCKTENDESYQVRDSEDAEAPITKTKTPTKSNTIKQINFDNIDSESEQKPEANIAEWTMLPRKACSKAKQKISQLSKLAKRQKSFTKSSSQQSNEKNIREDDDVTDEEDLPTVPWLK
uniref:uncharacterized protein LOC120336899 n=1 Tax=Styela clava TaxID=7725 RepID=UPI0019398982|nr:uncharacterized protein LOC120336899 [Styela clava]